VRQHTKLNQLPEDFGGGGWLRALAQIAMLELFLREKFMFLGQTTGFLPGCDLTSPSREPSSKHTQCILQALTGVTFLQEGV